MLLRKSFLSYNIKLNLILDKHLRPKIVMCGLRKEDTVLRISHAKGEWEKPGFLCNIVTTLNILPHLGKKTTNCMHWTKPV
jgi:hypothetical protein